MLLEKMRLTIQNAAPQATEKIAYGIPTFVLRGNLVHFGGYTKHIGFYPSPSAITHFKKELSNYETAKGSVKFKLEEPIPFDLITKIVKFRVTEETSKTNKQK